MRTLMALAVSFGLLFPTARVVAQESDEETAVEEPKDADGAKDHPAVRRYPGSIIVEMERKEFEEATFPAGPEKTTKAEGQYYKALYGFPGKTSCTQIVRNYENALKAAGFSATMGTELPPEVAEALGEAQRWVAGVGHSKAGGQIHVVQTCTESHNDNRNFRGPIGTLLVVETKAMEQKVEVTSDFLADEIEKSGKVALYGINFATGKADITPDSAKTLEQIAKLLGARPQWKLRIDGHTDNVGKPATNLELSKNRAQAVKAWLTGKSGIKAERLTTDGFGDQKPVADNATEPGRARNRRVELVKVS